jgi:acyl-coenzyme A synthetase/AMP-(fatty) acid ligase
VEAQGVLRPGSRPRAADILGLCRNHIAEFKVPKAVHFVDTLPKGPTGKVLKRILRSS